MPGTAVARLAAGETVVQIEDLASEPIPGVGRRALVEEVGARTAIWVALRKDGAAIGCFNIYRTEVHPFTDKQIALLENFAAQAVIAMENARLLTETREALEQQTATAQVLQVINSSPGNLAPVFDAMLGKARRLCEAELGLLLIYEGGCFRAVSLHGAPEAYVEFMTREPIRPGPNTGLERLVRQQRLVHIADLSAEQAYRERDPLRVASVELAGMRTFLAVPLVKEEALLGAFVLYRQEVRPFSERQTALLQNFAAQAVIAMENGRLLTETREALEQQTATAEVLQVINSSPGDLAPVFDAMLEKAMRLCDAVCGHLYTYDGERFCPAAVRGERGFAEWWRRNGSVRPATGAGPLGRIVLGEAIVVTDYREDPAYSAIPEFKALVDAGGLRSGICVALRKDNSLLGTIHIYRQEVRPFSVKQIALLQNFAAQAVIAMENARLLTETREALQHQTATAEVLGVINSSPGELAPVFDAILEKAHALCGVDHGSLQLYDGEMFRAVAIRGAVLSVAEQLRRPRRPNPNFPTHRLFAGDPFVHVPDLAEIDAPSAVKLAGLRTVLYVALRKEETFLGFIGAGRKEVRPFTEKQIALLQNFAAQAVIAMENARLLTETREALEQQTATAEVLQVINSSPGDLTPVFDAMLERALRLCQAEFGNVTTYDGERFAFAAVAGHSEFSELARRNGPGEPRPGTTMERTLRGESVIHIPDMADDDGYRSGTPVRRALVEIGGFRSLLCAALRKDDRLLGMFHMYRQEVRPFTDKQIALLQNFAAQAVIAMENARLIGELRQRTRDLQESLEYQTATSDVLKVISQSGTELEPVLQTLVETAAKICDADKAVLQQFQNGVFRIGASFGLVQEFKDYRARNPILADRGTPIGRMALERRVVHIEDALNDPDFTDLEAQRLGKFRTMLAVPLLRAGTVIGGLFLARSRVEPFTEKQIALVTTFADQAVIAIENARLIDELRSVPMSSGARSKS